MGVSTGLNVVAAADGACKKNSHDFEGTEDGWCACRHSYKPACDPDLQRRKAAKEPHCIEVDS